MESNQPIAQRDGYAFEEVVEADETHAVYRHYECAELLRPSQYTFQNMRVRGRYGCGHVLHRPGKTCRVTETKCCANGDPYCEFLVEVL